MIHIKHFKIVITLFTLIITVSSCANKKTFEDGNQSINNYIYVSDDGQRAHYRGKIHPQGFEYLKEVFKQSTTKHNKAPTALQISSTGGSGITGLAMGHWVKDNKLNVSVGRRCMSACANYIFVAGVNKILGKDSVLMWHGVGFGMSTTTADANLSRQTEQKLSEKEIDKLYSQVKVKPGGKMPSREEFKKVLPTVMKGNSHSEFWLKESKNIESFYASINTAPMIGDYGYLQQPNFSEEGLIGFDYSLEDLAYLGVDNIILSENIWEPDVEGKIFRVERKTFKNWKVQ